MEMATRSGQVSAAFVRISATLMGDSGGEDLLQTVVEQAVDLLDAVAAGVMLADAGGTLRLLASTGGEPRLVELLQQDSWAGPFTVCYMSGTPVAVGDIAGTHERWPQFSEAAGSMGYRAVHAFPMRMRSTAIGAIILFRTEVGEFTDEDRAIGQALADLSTISVLQERTLQESAVANGQLRRALESRVLVEQAKGMIAEMRNITMNEAFRLLRDYARANNQKLDEIAKAVLDRSLTV